MGQAVTKSTTVVPHIDGLTQPPRLSLERAFHEDSERAHAVCAGPPVLTWAWPLSGRQRSQ